MDRVEPNEIGIGVVADVAAGAPNIEQTADIFKLDIDCFEETFDFLPIDDLVSVGKTCKRLEQVAGYCYQQNYSGRAKCWDFQGVMPASNSHDVNHFAPFKQTIEIKFLKGLKFFLNVQSKYRCLKQIRLNRVLISANDVNRLNETLAKVEVLQLIDLELNGNNQLIIDQCTKLKRLEIALCEGDYSWLDRTYPTMEYLKFIPGSGSIDGLPMFLERNPNIQKFATTDTCLLKNRDALMTANIKLDELFIELLCPDDELFDSVCRLLNELHERGFYKRLQFYIKVLQNFQLIIDQTTVNGLVKCCASSYSDSNAIALSAVESLEEIAVTKSAFISDWGVLANKLTNLKRIHLKEATIDNIMPFIRRSLELRKIRIDSIRGGMHFSRETKIIDLLKLNKEREQLPDAEKITLYVEEKIYLATKWAMKVTDFGLIQIKRLESFEWDHDFNF